MNQQVFNSLHFCETSVTICQQKHFQCFFFLPTRDAKSKFATVKNFCWSWCETHGWLF